MASIPEAALWSQGSAAHSAKGGPCSALKERPCILTTPHLGWGLEEGAGSVPGVGRAGTLLRGSRTLADAVTATPREPGRLPHGLAVLWRLLGSAKKPPPFLWAKSKTFQFLKEI